MYYPLRKQKGFTLAEVVVSVTIFAGVITLMLTLFNYTLRIYRRVEAQRQVSQTVRTVMEFLTKEIRNGKIDYNIENGLTLVSAVDSQCPAPSSLSANTYTASVNPVNTKFLALINLEGERECVYWDSVAQSLKLKKQSVVAVSELTPPNVKVLDFRFHVRPLHDPYTDSPNLVERQPVVTLVAKLSVTLPTGEVRIVLYQTSVSTYQYDIPTQ